MRCFWLKFTDGSQGHCEGQDPCDAVLIAEKLTGKTVDGPEFRYRQSENPNVQPLPYPSSQNIIWQFDHPVNGVMPGFCYGGAACRGRGSCPKKPSCVD